MLLLIFKLQWHFINMARNKNNDVVMNVEDDIKLIKVEELLGKFQSKSALYTMQTCHSKFRAKNYHSFLCNITFLQEGHIFEVYESTIKGW